jgi:hypothetical protein
MFTHEEYFHKFPWFLLPFHGKKSIAGLKSMEGNGPGDRFICTHVKIVRT